jgi:hypothetical protein
MNSGMLYYIIKNAVNMFWSIFFCFCSHLTWDAEVFSGCAQALESPIDVYGVCLFLANLTAPSFVEMHWMLGWLISSGLDSRLKEVALAKFQTLSWYLPYGTVEGHCRSIGTASMRAEIWIWDFPDINLEFQLFMSHVWFLSLKVIPVAIVYCCRPLPEMF